MAALELVRRGVDTKAAAANVIVAHIAEQGGHPRSFLSYLKYGSVVTLLSLVLAAAYIGVRYF